MWANDGDSGARWHVWFFQERLSFLQVSAGSRRGWNERENPVTRTRALNPRFAGRKLGFMDNWIVADPEHLGGSPRVRGTRISVALILESLAAGMTIAQIVDAYPSLTEESVRGALAELAHRKDLQPA